MTQFISTLKLLLYSTLFYNYPLVDEESQRRHPKCTDSFQLFLNNFKFCSQKGLKKRIFFSLFV